MIVSTPRGDFGVLDHGEGPAVLLLHPLALSGELWRPLVEATPGLRFLAVDARGHGRTPWDGRPFSVEDMAADAAAVLEALGVASAGVVGLSMGGSTAVVLAGRRPDLVGALVLADATACYGPDRVAAWEARARKVTSTPRQDQVPFQLDRWFSPDLPARDPAAVRRVVDIFLATDSGAHAAACRALGGVDATDLLPAITAPTLVLVGEDDYATPPAMSEALRQGIPDARLEVLPGTRHLSVVDSPRAWPLIVDHLRASVGAGTRHA